MPTQITLAIEKRYPETVFATLLSIILFLLLANSLGIVAKYYFDHDYVYGLVSLFDFATEKNVPSYYSALALAGCSLLLTFIATTHRRNGSAYLLWAGLALIFLFMSVDEALSIHEKLVEPVRNSVNATGLLYYAWVIPYGIATLVFALGYFRFLLNLPKKIALLFVVSGSIFVTGAIGFELLEGQYFSMYGSKDQIVYCWLYTCEEFLEMLGIAIFIYALLLYIKLHLGQTQFFDSVKNSPAKTTLQTRNEARNPS